MGCLDLGPFLCACCFVFPLFVCFVLCYCFFSLFVCCVCYFVFFLFPRLCGGCGHRCLSNQGRRIETTWSEPSVHVHMFPNGPMGRALGQGPRAGPIHGQGPWAWPMGARAPRPKNCRRNFLCASSKNSLFFGFPQNALKSIYLEPQQNSVQGRAGIKF